MSDFARYSRQVVLREVGVNGQQLLRDSTVLVVGLGGLGSAAAQYLAGAGVGRLVLADRDRVELSNLHRQTLYRQSDVGLSKSVAAQAQLAALNPQSEGLAAEGEAWRTWVPQADVVLDCTDNFSSRHAINAACAAARRPLVSGAAIRWQGQWAAFDLRQGGPCYACLYPVEGDEQEACEEAGILGPVVGVIGSLQALAALQILLGRPSPCGRLHLWDARRLDWRSLTIPPDPQCPVCGQRGTVENRDGR